MRVGPEVDAAVELVFAVGVHCAGGFVYGLVDNVVLQLRRVREVVLCRQKFP